MTNEQKTSLTYSLKTSFGLVFSPSYIVMGSNQFTKFLGFEFGSVRFTESSSGFANVLVEIGRVFRYRSLLMVQSRHECTLAHTDDCYRERSVSIAASVVVCIVAKRCMHDV